MRPLLLAATGALLACGGSHSDAALIAPRPIAVEPATPEPSAVGTITEAELRAHVELLASDEYAGRETLTEGAAKAAAYLAGQFKAYGLSPLPGQKSFIVPYTLDQFRYSSDDNTISFVGTAAKGAPPRQLVLGTDFTPFNFSDSGSLENAEVVFAGYGITAPDLKWDDYKGLNVKGKVVLVLRHTPDEKNESGAFANTNHGLFTTKALNAQSHGATAMLIVTDAEHPPESDDFSTTGFVRLPATAEEKERRDKRLAAMKAAQKSQPQLLALHISQAAAGELLATQRRGERNLKELQAKLESGQLKPKSVVLRARASVSVKDPTEPVAVHPDNVIGYLEGSDPSLKHELVVVGGHYDHLGRDSGKEGSEVDVIYNGADDNASGTAGVLELAQAFGSLKTRPARSLVFVGFSGEEKGLLGSFAMMREHQLDESKIAFMLNLDMIGRNSEKPVEILGDAYATSVKDVVLAANKDIGLDIAFSGTNYSGSSDHHPFYVRDIPMMFFFTGLHKDYHQLSDHADLVDFARMEKIVRVGYGVIESIAAGAARPSFIHNLGWLGARIEIVGTGEAARATFTDIEKDSRGAKAGLAAGDAIAAIDGKLLSEPTKVGARFREIEPGNTVALDIVRAGKQQVISVVRAKAGFLGVFPTDVKDEDRKKHGLGEDEGVGIRGVTKGGPADKAGIKDGDILIRIAGVPVNSSGLGKTLARIGAGEEVAITVIRGDDRIDLTMVLGERG